MPSIHKDPKSGIWKYHFDLFEKRFKRSLGTTDEGEARSLEGRYNATHRDIQSGRLTPPPEALTDVERLWAFIASDGQRDRPAVMADVLTVEGLFTRYFDTLPPGAKGKNTRQTEEGHRKHLQRVLGRRQSVAGLTRDSLQGYVNTRANERTAKGSNVQPDTIKKELATLRMAWNRHVAAVGVPFPTCRPPLDYPHSGEKLPFQTWEQIETNVQRGNLTDKQIDAQWDSLFLNLEQVKACLDFIQDKTQDSPSKYFYPLMVFVAHTGVRRSEAARAQRADFRFGEGVVMVRELKRVKGRQTFRSVPMSPRLQTVMRDYFENHHPGGEAAFYNADGEPVAAKSLGESFDWFLRTDKWKVLKGFHVFRHSFASNLACSGKDQRVIDAIMGHETEAMRRRYRHLFPVQAENAIASLYG